jgi:DNA gyrase subunit A
VVGAETKEGDFVSQFFIASTHAYILFFTNLGRVYWQKVYDIPEMSRTSRGRSIATLLRLGQQERITAAIPVREFDERFLVMATEKGLIKKVPLEAFSRPKRGGIIALALSADDRLVGTHLTTGQDELMLGTAQGKVIRFSEREVRPMGRNAQGVRAIKLGHDDRVCGLIVVPLGADQNGHSILTVCERGYGKRTPFKEYRRQGRGGSGLINIRITPRNGSVVALRSVNGYEDIILATTQGMVVRIPVRSIRLMGRATRGVKLLALAQNDRVVAVALVRED